MATLELAATYGPSQVEEEIIVPKLPPDVQKDGDVTVMAVEEVDNVNCESIEGKLTEAEAKSDKLLIN